MRIHEVSVKRPVAILMCVLIVLVLGGVSLSKIPVDLLPDISYPIAIVSTTYSGVAPQEIESIVTKPIENAIATVNNVKSIQSISSEGSSTVIVEFNSGTDMDFATLNMREKIDMIKGFLPDDVGDPVVMKMDPSMLPVVTISVTNGSDEIKLKSFTEENIKPRLERLSGVTSVSLAGGRTQEIQVNVDPQRASGYGISLNQIMTILQTENLNLPGGTVEYGGKKLLVRSTGEFHSIEQIKNIPISMANGTTIYVRDIAEVVDTTKPIESYSRTNGRNSISLSVQKQTNANTVTVARAVKEEIEKIIKEYPDLNIDVVFDQGQYIEMSVSNVANNAILGGVLAVLILFVFLKNIRTTLIIATAIPISIIATFVMVYFAGISLNIVSLGGLALGVGMLVDNAIVVLENIYRHRSEGYNRIEAALYGTKEVGNAILASTMTTIVVFLPIAFTEGIAAQLFKDMALTITFSLVASLIVALSFIPMLSSKFLKTIEANEGSRNKLLNIVMNKWDNVINSLDKFYQRILKWVLKHKAMTLVIVLSIFIFSLTLIPFIGSEFMPAMDQGMFTIDIEMPKGSLLENTNEIAEKLEDMLSKIPEVETVYVSVGGSGVISMTSGSSSDTASISVTLKSLKDRERSTSEVVEEIRNSVKNIAGANISITELSTSFGGMFGGDSVSIQISGPDLEKLEDISKDVVQIVSATKGTREVESSISEGRPEAQIYVNRDKASAYGLSTTQIASVIRTAVEGNVATTYKVNGTEIDIKVQYPEDKRNTLEQLKSISILSPLGMKIPLLDVAQVKLEQGPTSISRVDQERYVTVTADVFGRSSGDVNEELEEKLKTYSLPEGYSIKFTGENELMVEAFQDLTLALILAVVLVYMVMAIQFESLVHPLTIMFSVPVAYSGSLFGLAITRTPISVPGFIGAIMLAGIVVNNAIVLVDYINTLRGRGLGRDEAIIKAGPTRLRPILMTTLTTILALIPSAIGLGEGAEAMAPLAIVVMFGLTTSTILTLLIVPVIYCFFDNITMIFKKKSKNPKAELDVNP
ncbi:efflux RND transporter permease subunit [Lutispora thermophila]|uniref:Hydrophobic/amphiphilic exporter-1, HAE1 family n=1 Tax=Lutispora thermophila DSM 19022 TaxID=1122184 RepID=A0A1M6HC49_9FIRM|nr:efflux RND transporter permease subunit [Lutispora thermophila]SHJ19780.1 hydrophobic/amphiphilic exporter-1, HAE1 family [Lutispora thermophila DSM 19022]